MNKREWAEKLNGHRYGNEVTSEEAEQLGADGLVVVYGASDDLIEFAGAIYDEREADHGKHIRIHSTGVLEQHDQDDCECEFCGYESKAKLCATIKTIWDDGEYSWSYETNIPHATFEIMDGSEKYCRGMVIEISSLPVI